MANDAPILVATRPARDPIRRWKRQARAVPTAAEHSFVSYTVSRRCHLQDLVLIYKFTVSFPLFIATSSPSSPATRLGPTSQNVSRPKRATISERKNRCSTVTGELSKKTKRRTISASSSLVESAFRSGFPSPIRTTRRTSSASRSTCPQRSTESDTGPSLFRPLL